VQILKGRSVNKKFPCFPTLSRGAGETESSSILNSTLSPEAGGEGAFFPPPLFRREGLGHSDDRNSLSLKERIKEREDRFRKPRPGPFPRGRGEGIIVHS